MSSLDGFIAEFPDPYPFKDAFRRYVETGELDQDFLYVVNNDPFTKVAIEVVWIEQRKWWRTVRDPGDYTIPAPFHYHNPDLTYDTTLLQEIKDELDDRSDT